MFRNIPFIFLLSILSLCYTASASSDWTWAKSVGGSADDKANGIIKDNNGNLYVVGKLQGDSILINGKYYSTNGYSVAYIAKYSQTGQFVWAKMLNGDGNSETTAVSSDNNGNLYVAGSFTGTYLNISDTQLLNSGTENIFLACYNASGTLKWARAYGGNAIDIPTVIKVSKDTILYLAGKISSDTIFFDTKMLTADVGFDAFILRGDTRGNIYWVSKLVGTGGNSVITAMDCDGNSNVYFVGSYSDSAITIGQSKYINNSNGLNDVFAGILDKNANLQWSTAFGGDNNDEPYCINKGGGVNDLYIGGKFASSSISFDGSYTLYNQGGDDGFIVDYGASATVKWCKAIASPNNETVSFINGTVSDSIYIAGVYDGDSLVVDNFVLSTQGLKDIYFLKCDSNQLITETQSLGGNGDDEAGGVCIIDASARLAVVGNYESDMIGDFTLKRVGSTDIFLISQYAGALSDNSDNYTTAKDGGLYAGYLNDLTYSSYNNRLFAAVSTPASLFYSDDTANTWHPAFPVDSLRYSQDTRGWGGKGFRVCANTLGWIVAITGDPVLQYSSIVANYQGGDPSGWNTFVDPTALSQYGYDKKSVSAVAISDYFIYAAMGPYIMRGDASGIDVNSIVNVTTVISGLSSSSVIVGVAVANSTSGFPCYIAIDENGSKTHRRLFKYDGVQFTEILFGGLNINGIANIATHPGQHTGDTLFITARDVNNADYKIFRSFDGGNSWQDISFAQAKGDVSEADFSPYWQSQLTSSNGLILIIPGLALSKDMGNTWEKINASTAISGAVHPENLSVMVGGRFRAGYSINGASGTYSLANNEQLSALTINKIARTANKSVFYVATASGLGYTTAYLDTTVSGGDKWKSPYGSYPLLSDTVSFGAVAIDANDSAHVITGCPYGFCVTQTGPTGFSSLITPSGFISNNPQVHDIAILNSNIVLAVSGGDSAVHSGMGSIWRSADGGYTWTNISPSGFSNGNSIAVGYTATDTTIYVGTGLLDIDTGSIWKSIDLGQTWSRVNIGPTSMSGSGINGLCINDIDIVPGTSDSLYIAAGNESDYAFAFTSDGGITYTNIDLQGPSGFTSVAINKNGYDSVYVAIDNLIYTYIASTNEYHLIYKGLPGERVPDLMHGSILVGTTTGFYTFQPGWEDDSLITSVPENKNILNNNNTLLVYPNPLTNYATIKISLQEKTPVTLHIYDIMGKKVIENKYGCFDPGICEIPFSASALVNGQYFIKLQMNDALMYQKIIVSK